MSVASVFVSDVFGLSINAQVIEDERPLLIVVETQCAILMICYDILTLPFRLGHFQ